MNIRKIYANRKSLAVTLPVDVSALTGIRRGDCVSVTVNQAKQIVLTKIGAPGADSANGKGR